MKRMLDTNICSHVLRRHPPGMLERFSRLEQATRPNNARECLRVPGLAVEEW